MTTTSSGDKYILQETNKLTDIVYLVGPTGFKLSSLDQQAKQLHLPLSRTYPLKANGNVFVFIIHLESK